MSSDDFVSCVACGCPFTMLDLQGLRELSDSLVSVTLECHCGWDDEFQVASWDWAEWVNEHCEVFRSMLDEVSVEDVALGWVGQKIMDPGSIPIEVN